MNSELAVHRRLGEYLADHDCEAFVVAFSGGRDSTVLLHLVANFAAARPTEVRALHVDHGLHPDSSRWADHCQRTAQSLGLNCDVVRISGRPGEGESVEAWARDQRYAALARHCLASTCVLTAHHRDDQAETVLHRVVSGAGPHGLSGMPMLRRLGRGYLLRPMLNITAQQIDDYASDQRLSWVEDPTNQGSRYLRNRLRHDVLPLLEAAYPGAASGLVRMAALQRDVAANIDRACEMRLAEAGLPAHQLALSSLHDCGPDFARFLLRYAILQAGLQPASERCLREIVNNLCSARADATPLVCWGDNQVRRYRARLYFLKRPDKNLPTKPLPWSLDARLHIAGGTLTASPAAGPGLDLERLNGAEITVGLRQGGEICRRAGHRNHKRLKTLFQSWNVPPWERDRTPLIYVNGELAAVAGHCICHGYAVAHGGLALEWESGLYQSAPMTN